MSEYAGMKIGDMIDIRSLPGGMPFIVERADGWYVEMVCGDRLLSVGPGTKEQAEAIYKDVRETYDRWNREHLS